MADAAHVEVASEVLDALGFKFQYLGDALLRAADYGPIFINVVRAERQGRASTPPIVDAVRHLTAFLEDVSPLHDVQYPANVSFSVFPSLFLRFGHIEIPEERNVGE